MDRSYVSNNMSQHDMIWRDDVEEEIVAMPSKSYNENDEKTYFSNMLFYLRVDQLGPN